MDDAQDETLIRYDRPSAEWERRMRDMRERDMMRRAWEEWESLDRCLRQAGKAKES